MKLYYYTYETCVHSPWFKANGDLNTAYDHREGFLFDSPLGFVHFDDDGDPSTFNWDNLIEFEDWVNEQYPKNFGIVELK